jgi:16S rRNA processing protein RimM
VDDADTVLLQPGEPVVLNDDQYRIRALRRGDKGWQIAFEDHGDRQSVESLRGAEVFVAARRQLEDDEFWIEDLIGLEVTDDRGTDLGKVTDVVFGPAQDRLVISGENGEFEVPFVADLVPVVDTSSGRIEVKWIEGLVSEPRSQP